MIKVIKPEYINLKNWAAALVFDYYNEPLPLLLDETKWQEWATIVAGTGVFKRAAIPTPFTITEGKKRDSFANWEAWAKVVYNIMSNEKNLNPNIGG